MRSSRRKLLSRLMCFVMGLSCGTNAGAHQKKKSSSNESLNLAEKVVVGSTFLMIYQLILKPLGSSLLSRSGDNHQFENDEQNNIKCIMKNNDEDYGELKRRNYIQNVLNSIDKTVDEGSKYKWLRTIPNSLNEIRQVLHCLFLWYSTLASRDVRNVKLTIGKNINWSYYDNIEKALEFESVYKVLEWYSQNSKLGFYYDNVVPGDRFGFVIQRWAEKMGFSKIEIVMNGVGGYYVNEYYRSGINFKIHGFKYQLSYDERMILMKKLGLKDTDTLEVFNDNEVIEIKGKNMEDDNYGNKIIIHENDDISDDDN